MVDPADIPLTTPVEELIVAAAGFDEFQTIVPVAVVANVIVDPTQTAANPVIAGVAGNGLTVTVAVFSQPTIFVKVIILVPPETPVTNPLLSTVATVGVAETQGEVAAGESVLVNCVCWLAQIVRFPVMAGGGVQSASAKAEPFRLFHPLKLTLAAAG